MQTQNVSFAVTTKDGVVQEIGKSTILQPSVKFNGGSVKWYEDKPKAKWEGFQHEEIHS